MVTGEPASSQTTRADDVIFLPYRSEDAEQCARVFERAWNAGHPYAPRMIGMAEFLLAIRDRNVVVARTGAGRVVGFAGVYVPDRFIHHLYVDPAWSGGGIGRGLLAHALHLAGGRATLKCQVRNEGALRFYEREGWRFGERGETDGELWVRLHSPETQVAVMARSLVTAGRGKGPTGCRA
jgi:GNAT superfamily N-acetyltransferase